MTFQQGEIGYEFLSPVLELGFGWGQYSLISYIPLHERELFLVAPNAPPLSA